MDRTLRGAVGLVGRRVAATIALCAPAALGAQRLPSSPWREASPALQMRQSAPALGPTIDLAAAAPRAVPLARVGSRDRPPSPAPYLVGGGLVGAVTTGLVLANSIRHCDDCMVFPQLVIGAVAIGTSAGVAGGGLVYLVRRSFWTPPRQATR